MGWGVPYKITVSFIYFSIFGCWGQSYVIINTTFLQQLYLHHEEIIFINKYNKNKIKILPPTGNLMYQYRMSTIKTIVISCDIIISNLDTK